MSDQDHLSIGGGGTLLPQLSSGDTMVVTTADLEKMKSIQQQLVSILPDGSSEMNQDNVSSTVGPGPSSSPNNVATLSGAVAKARQQGGMAIPEALQVVASLRAQTSPAQQQQVLQILKQNSSLLSAFIKQQPAQQQAQQTQGNIQRGLSSKVPPQRQVREDEIFQDRTALSLLHDCDI